MKHKECIRVENKLETLYGYEHMCTIGFHTTVVYARRFSSHHALLYGGERRVVPVLYHPFGLHIYYMHIFIYVRSIAKVAQKIIRL